MRILHFYADWCAPCKKLEEELKTVEQELNTLPIEHIDIEVDIDAAMKYNITSIPVLILEDNGAVLDRIVGFRNSAELIQRFTPFA